MTFGKITFFTVFSFVAWVADAGPHDAGSMVAARDVNALVGGNITFGAFPTAVTHAATFKVLTIPAAQHWTRSFEKSRRHIHTDVSGLLQARLHETGLFYSLQSHCQNELWDLLFLRVKN